MTNNSVYTSRGWSMGLLALSFGILGIIMIISAIIYWRSDSTTIILLGLIFAIGGLFFTFISLLLKTFKISSKGIEYWSGKHLEFKLQWKDISWIKNNTQTSRTSKAYYSSSEIFFSTKSDEKFSIIEDTGFNRPTLKVIFNKIVEYQVNNPNIKIIDKEGWLDN